MSSSLKSKEDIGLVIWNFKVGNLIYLEMEKEELQSYYPEFAEYEAECKFGGCAHISEPVCGVKAALQDGKISKVRYENYVVLYNELKDRKKY